VVVAIAERERRDGGWPDGKITMKDDGDEKEEEIGAGEQEEGKKLCPEPMPYTAEPQDALAHKPL
jgi:hypothetical protein